MAKIDISDKDRKGADSLELRSYQLREILGQIPRWIVRYGTLVILLILIILITGSSIIKYPDIISARIKLTTETPPAELNAKVSAKIEKLLVVDKEIVEQGQVLAVFESAADYIHVFELREIIGEGFVQDTLVQKYYPDNLNLGSIQDSYALFQKRVQEYNSFLRLDYHNRKIQSVTNELNKYSRFVRRLMDQEAVLEQDFALVQKQYQRDSLLFIEQVIASSQLEKSEALKLGKLNELKEIQTKLASSQIEISNLQQEVLELELNLEEKGRQHDQSLREAFEMLNGQISLWQEKYLILSSFKGQVSLTKIWSENQNVEEGEIVLTVLPLEQGYILGKVYLSAKGVGKVKVGHKVVMRFDNYPHMEFGTISGKIASISLVPYNDQYTAEVRLDSSRLITNYSIELNFQQNMPGYAEVITDQRSLLNRILDPFRSALNRQKTLNQ